MRDALHHLGPAPIVDHVPDLAEHLGRLARVSQLGRDVAFGVVQHRIKQHEGNLPARPRRFTPKPRDRQIECHFVPERPVQLRLQRVQDQVDLIEQQRAALEQRQELASPLNLLAHELELFHGDTAPRLGLPAEERCERPATTLWSGATAAAVESVQVFQLLQHE